MTADLDASVLFPLLMAGHIVYGLSGIWNLVGERYDKAAAVFGLSAFLRLSANGVWLQ